MSYRDLSLRFDIISQSTESSVNVGKDIVVWWDNMEDHEKSDYLSTLDNLRTGDKIWLADYGVTLVHHNDGVPLFGLHIN